MTDKTSKLNKKKHRCSGCGRWSAGWKTTEYTRRKDGVPYACGYMWPTGNVLGDESNADPRIWCDDCIENGTAERKIAEVTQ